METVVWVKPRRRCPKQIFTYIFLKGTSLILLYFAHLHGPLDHLQVLCEELIMQCKEASRHTIYPIKSILGSPELSNARFRYQKPVALTTQLNDFPKETVTTKLTYHTLKNPIILYFNCYTIARLLFYKKI